jgi:magnesium transporter
MEDYDSYIYAVLKMMILDEKRKEIIIDQVSIIFGSNYILSFQERERDVFNPIRDRFKNPASRCERTGWTFLHTASWMLWLTTIS